MKLGVLFSGGKDSTYAAYVANKVGHELSLLISMESKRDDSYMFHVPNIRLTRLAAESMGIPLLLESTCGVKEKEVEDLEKTLIKAKKSGILGIVTGAVASTYQASRIQRVCNNLGLWCFNPLWQKDQMELLHEIVDEGFEVIIVGVSAYPLTEEWLGRRLDDRTLRELGKLAKDFKLNPAGEGGEIETLVLSSPLHKKKIILKRFTKVFSNYSGHYVIQEADLA